MILNTIILALCIFSSIYTLYSVIKLANDNRHRGDVMTLFYVSLFASFFWSVFYYLTL